MAKALALAALLIVAAALAAPEGVHGVCNMSNDGIQACLPAAAMNHPTDGPSAGCCAALSVADMPCLCRYKSSGALARFYKIDANRAMELPGKCGIALPSNC